VAGVAPSAKSTAVTGEGRVGAKPRGPLKMPSFFPEQKQNDGSLAT
jgi:hypothetical protein